MKLSITAASRPMSDQDYDKLYELSNNGLEIYPKEKRFPMPWDATATIENKMFILSGYLGPMGPRQGTAEVRIPLDKVNEYLDISIRPLDEESEEELYLILSNYDWIEEDDEEADYYWK